MGQRLAWSPAKTAVLMFVTLPFLIPFLFLTSTAVRPLSDFTRSEAGFPTHLTMANLEVAWRDAGLGPAFIHSLVTVTLAVPLILSISLMGGVWFLRHTSRPARIMRYVLVGSIAIPRPVIIIPLFVGLSDFGLADNLVMLAVVFAGSIAGFGLYFTHSHLRSLPIELFEAAEIDGASLWQMMLHVFLPLSKPVLATIGSLAFIWFWGDLLIAVVLVQDPSQRLATPAVTLLADEYWTNIPAMAAGVLIVLLPMLWVFFLAQRWLAKGILAGMGK